MILLTIAIILSRFPQNLQILIIKTFLQKLHRWSWAFCSHIDLCIVHLHFLRVMNLHFSTIAIFYMRICAYFGVRFMSIGVKFVLGTKRTLKRNLTLLHFILIMCVCVYSGFTSLSTFFQSYHDGVWLRQGAQCSLILIKLILLIPKRRSWI